jgi:hypothetical protein
MKTFGGEGSEEAARAYMHMKNTTTRCNDWQVLVAGPGDEEWTVMSLREAIESDFVFEWEGSPAKTGKE